MDPSTCNLLVCPLNLSSSWEVEQGSQIGLEWDLWLHLLSWHAESFFTWHALVGFWLQWGILSHLLTFGTQILLWLFLRGDARILCCSRWIYASIVMQRQGVFLCPINYWEGLYLALLPYCSHLLLILVFATCYHMCHSSFSLFYKYGSRYSWSSNMPPRAFKLMGSRIGVLGWVGVVYRVVNSSAFIGGWCLVLTVPWGLNVGT